MRDSVAREVARLSIREIEDAVAPAPARTRGARALRAAAAVLARWPSARLGDVLARFDARIGEVGIARSARDVLATLGASLAHDGAIPRTGPVLVVANHPGAYDALAIAAALGRDDVAFVAADRAFLRAMPHLREHLVFVADPGGDPAGVIERARGLRRALRWLDDGGVLVQFGAGAIETDARFAGPKDDILGAWGDGTGLLAGRAVGHGAAIVPCLVAGVHSPRAKRLFIVRWAERRGVTTIASLVQATLPGFRDVAVTVRIGAPLLGARLRDAGGAKERAVLVREAVRALSAPAPREDRGAPRTARSP